MKNASWILLVLVLALSACERAGDAPAAGGDSAGPEEGVSPDEPYAEVLDTTPDAAEEDAAENGESQP